LAVTINAPIYINRNLILDLYATLIDGYIDYQEILTANFNDNNLKVQSSHRKGENKEDKKTDTKDKNVVNEIGSNYLDEYFGCIDVKNSSRDEMRIKKIYTSFHIFNKMKELMKENRMIKTIRDTEVKGNQLALGEYMEFEGTISAVSIQSQINTAISIFEAYDPKVLDKLLISKDTEESLTTFSVLLKQLKILSDLISKNNTVTMIVENSHFSFVLNVNLNYFLDKNSYIYDQVNCKCKVLCKVIRVTGENESINLLDKTCMADYYEKLLELLKLYLSVLEKNNIIVPKIMSTKIGYPSIQAIPIAIYV
jgi:hypothetical protein